MTEFNTDGTLTLVNGRGQFKHKIQSPKEAINAFVNAKVLTPVNWTGDSIVDLNRMILVSKPSPPSGPTVTYTITSVKTGNIVYFTIKSNPPTSIEPVNVTITEYKPGSPNTTIKTQAIDIAMVDGVGTTTYNITQTQPTVDQIVEGKITTTPSIKSEVTVPKYVAPPVEDPNKVGQTYLQLIPDGRTLGRTGELLCYYRSDGWGNNYRGSTVTAAIYLSDSIVATGSSNISDPGNSTNSIVRYTYSVSGPTTVKFTTSGPAGTGQTASIYIK